MSNTKRDGIKVRYFQVTYPEAKVEKHFAALHALILAGVHTKHLGSAPEENGGTTVAFMVSEACAERYLKMVYPNRRTA